MTKPSALFRREAVEHQRVRDAPGEALALDRSATRWGFGLLCAGTATLLVFVCLGRINEYASGPALIQVDGYTSLTASSAGLVTRVSVKPGDRVAPGDELVQLHAAEEQAELRVASEEFDRQLAKLLLRPYDAATREALVSLRTRRDLAGKRLEQRTLRAAASGVIGDVRVREGQLVEPGMRMVDLQGSATLATVTALLPGRYLPLLHAGDPLRFHIDGFQHVVHELIVDHVGEQIVGPGEATRALGRDLSDAFSVAGPVVLVQARLPDMGFELDGQRYNFANGMYGRAEAPVRSEAIALAFIPGLKAWLQSITETAAPDAAPSSEPERDQHGD